MVRGLKTSCGGGRVKSWLGLLQAKEGKEAKEYVFPKRRQRNPVSRKSLGLFRKQDPNCRADGNEGIIVSLHHCHVTLWILIYFRTATWVPWSRLSSVLLSVSWLINCESVLPEVCLYGCFGFNVDLFCLIHLDNSHTFLTMVLMFCLHAQNFPAITLV